MADSPYDRQLQRLKALTMQRWWMLTGILWLVCGPVFLWVFRHDYQLVRQYFTWTAVRYGLAYNRLATLGLGVCIGMTVALLVAESRHILFGLSSGERQKLEKRLHRIQQQGPSHPLWSRINRDD